jgi:pimeloyl-ACP methyl ester carboxylesterase
VSERFEIAFDGALIRGAAAGFGLPVVFLHAGVADRRMWTDQMSTLASEGYHVVAYDRRGFGETTTDDVPFSHVVDLEAVLDRLGLNAVVLVGCSRGGALAIDFAIEHPERVVGLVLVGTALSGDEGGEREDPEEIEALLDTLRYAEERRNIDSVNRIEAHLWLDGPLSKEGRVDGPARDLFLDMNAIALNHPKLTQEEPPDPAADHFDRITAPVLLIVGALDFPHILDRHEDLAEELDDAYAIVLEDTAHLPSLEAPEAFTPLLLEFLEALAGRGEDA